MKIFRRLFGLEIEFLFGLLSLWGRGASARPAGPFSLSPVRRGVRARRKDRRGAALPPAPGESRGESREGRLSRTASYLGKRRDRILSTATSIIAHAALLLALVKIPTDATPPGEPLRELRISLRLPQATSPASPRAESPPKEARKPAVEVPEPPPPAPPDTPLIAPPAPQESEEDEEEVRPSVAVLEPDPSGDEPGAPGTGEIPRAEAEGRPGRAGVIGVGSSPPPGDGDGRGGEGQGEGMGSRSRGKAAAIKLYGGTGGTEDAVARGLAWLAAHQDGDGGWSAAGFSRHCRHFTQCTGKGLEEFDAGVTALSALAFLGAGQTPGGPGPYGLTVERALKSLIAGQRSDGALGARGHRYMYNHAIAALAICEAYAMTREARFLKPALSALNFSAASQQEGGGWDYTEAKSGRNDLSITGWQVMAFRAALAGSIPIPEDTLRRLREFLKGATTPSGEGIYSKKGIGEGRRGVNMAAVGLLSRLYVGMPVDDPYVEAAADRLMKSPPESDVVPDWDRSFQSTYYWYSAALCLFHLGGNRWEAWNHFLLREILPLQSNGVHEAGSWPADPNWLGSMGGRISSTAMNVLTLEVYYRYPPLHVYSHGKKRPK